MQFQLDVYEPLGTGTLRQAAPTMEFDSDETSFRITKTIDVGHSGCAIGMPPPDPADPYVGPLPESYDALPQLAYVRIRYGRTVIFGGQVVNVERGPGGVISGISTLGLASELSQRYVVSSDSSTAYTSGTLIQWILRQYASYLTIGSGSLWDDPGVAYVAAAVGGGTLTAGQAIDQIVKAGSTDGFDYDFRIRDRIATLERREPATEDGAYVGTYRVPQDALITRWSEDQDSLKTHVSVHYQDALTDADTTTAVAINTVLLARIGRIREIVLEGGKLTAEAAESFRDTYAARHSDVMVSGAIQRDDSRGLELRVGGAEVPPWLIEPGEFVETESGRLLVIRSVDFTSDTGVTSLDVGADDVSSDLYRMVGLTYDAMRNRINPVTGGKQATV